MEGEEPEKEENMNASDRKSGHSSKGTVEDNLHASDLKLGDQKEDKSRPRSPVKKRTRD